MYAASREIRSQRPTDAVQFVSMCIFPSARIHTTVRTKHVPGICSNRRQVQSCKDRRGREVVAHVFRTVMNEQHVFVWLLS